MRKGVRPGSQYVARTRDATGSNHLAICKRPATLHHGVSQGIRIDSISILVTSNDHSTVSHLLNSLPRLL